MIRFLRILFALVAILCFGLESSATHNKAGEITYRRISGLTYEITITTYTDPKSTQADRCELPISFGDGKTDSIPRINGPAISGCNHGGEVIVANKIKKNIYRTVHSYAGNGTYEILMTDPNRIEDIKNIPGSVGVPFTLKTTLRIHPLLGGNSSPVLNFPPIDDACICKPFEHNPGAVDPDGDSLSYKLSVCYGDQGKPIPGYSFPPPSTSPGCGKQLLSLDPRTGTFTWNAPGLSGKYNVCILITEWRLTKIPNRPPQWDSVGNVLRDMQIDVGPCQNDPPEFIPMADLCVIAGDTIEQEIVAYDDVGETVSLESTGAPFSLRNSPALFRGPGPQRDTIKGEVYWETQCSHVRKSDYLMTFKAKDASLANFTTLAVQIIGPKTENISLTPGQKSMILNWNPSPCGNITGYAIYRKADSTNWSPGLCETGIPSSLGFTKIDFVSGHQTTSYTDDNNGDGLFHGLIYCYRIVAEFSDGAESIASEEVCGELPFNTPIITRNSVVQTAKRNGIDSIGFAKPQEINLNGFPPPYSYKVFRDGKNGEELIYTSPDYSSWSSIDTFLSITGLNTSDSDQTFRFDLLSQGSSMGKSHKASSVFLEIKPDDKRLNLIWNEEVPWTNFSYIIFKEVNGRYVAIDTTAGNSYIDTGLVNGREYNYYVRSLGKYSIDQLANDTLYNNSQVVTGVPVDTIPPCQPLKPSIQSECELYRNELTWKNPNDSCFYKDAVKYRLYFTPTVGGDYQLIQEFLDIVNDTHIVFDNLSSVAGCYGISAVDSFENESPLSKRVCVDNCPIYELPNVFTPGGDGYNDFFTPIYPYRYVQDIDMTIYNRWGQVMFETTDPDIRWDGKSQMNGKQVPSGVYFYICTVNEIRLAGIIPRLLKGHITVINESSPGIQE
jgi:gliding motility-associated-like protein